jgi:hypothetical protein
MVLQNVDSVKEIRLSDGTVFSEGPLKATLDPLTAYFSFCSIDRSQTPHRLLGGRYIGKEGGDYEDDPTKGVLHWWNLDSARSLLEAKGGTITSVLVMNMNENARYVQGALSQGDKVWLSVAGGTPYLRYEDLSSNDEKDYTPWPDVCENLTYSPVSDNL